MIGFSSLMASQHKTHENKKAQAFTIRHTGLDKPSNDYGKLTLYSEPLIVGFAPFILRVSSSCGE